MQPVNGNLRISFVAKVQQLTLLADVMQLHNPDTYWACKTVSSGPEPHLRPYLLFMVCLTTSVTQAI
jgi:hypothetical protein